MAAVAVTRTDKVGGKTRYWFKYPDGTEGAYYEGDRVPESGETSGQRYINDNPNLANSEYGKNVANDPNHTGPGDEWDTVNNKAIAPALNALDPSKPYDDAAANLRNNIAPQYQAKGQQAWDRTQAAAGVAASQYNPATSQLANLGNYYAKPGEQQAAYGQYGGQYFAPTKTGGVMDQYSQYAAQPSQTQQAGSYAQGAIGGANRQGSQYDSAQGQLAGPSATSQYGGAAAGMAGQQSATDKYAGNAYSYAGQQGAGESFYQSQGQQLGGPGRMESNADSLVGRIGGDTRTGSMLSGLTGGGQTASDSAMAESKRLFAMGADKDDALRDHYRKAAGAIDITSNELGNTFREAQQLGQFANRQQGALESPGLYEQRVQQAMGEEDPLLERQRRKGMEALNQQMAARGAYASGGALQGLADYNANLDAQKYSQLNELARGSQAATMSRLGQAQGLAGAVSGETMGRGGALQGLSSSQRDFELRERNMQQQLGMQQAQMLQSGAGQQDAARLGRQSLAAGVAQNADQQDLARTNSMADYYGSADAAMNQRLGTMGSLANQAQNQAGNRTSFGADYAGQQDSTALGRAGMSLGAGQAMDQSTLARLGLLQSGAQGADAGDINRGESMFGVGQGMDAGEQEQFALLFQMAEAGDEQALARLDAYFKQAGEAQKYSDGRQESFYDKTFALGDAKAGQVLPFLQTGLTAQGTYDQGALSALTNATGLEAQGGQARGDTLRGLLTFGAGKLF